MKPSRSIQPYQIVLLILVISFLGASCAPGGTSTVVPAPPTDTPSPPPSPTPFLVTATFTPFIPTADIPTSSPVSPTTEPPTAIPDTPTVELSATAPPDDAGLPPLSGFTILHQFGSRPGNGRIPYGVLIFHQGILFGTTTYGGPPYELPPSNPANKGNLFRLRLDGSEFSVLRDFVGGPEDGWKPWSGLAAAGETLYGSTVYGGPYGEKGGVLYAINLDGSNFTLLHTFGGPGDGYGASTSPVLLGGSLYGMTRWGGNGTGMVYRYDLQTGAYTQLYHFAADGRDGSSPLGTLTPGNDGFLYGLTWMGGANNLGTLFRIRPDGTGFETLHHFTGGAQGKYPYDTLLFDGQHTLYGTTLGTYGNDPSDLGLVFKFDLADQTYTVLHRFAGGTSDSGKPNGGLALSPDKQTLYGTTHGDDVWGGKEFGVLYRMNLDGSEFKILHEFTGGLAGATPMRTPIIVGRRVCGLTAFGGAENYGLVYCFPLQ